MSPRNLPRMEFLTTPAHSARCLGCLSPVIAPPKLLCLLRPRHHLSHSHPRLSPVLLPGPHSSVTESISPCRRVWVHHLPAQTPSLTHVCIHCCNFSSQQAVCTPQGLHEFSTYQWRRLIFLPSPILQHIKHFGRQGLHADTGLALPLA